MLVCGSGSGAVCHSHSGISKHGSSCVCDKIDTQAVSM